MITNINILKSILFLPIIGLFFYNDNENENNNKNNNSTINYFTGSVGALLYITYTYFYKLCITNRFFSMFIAPINYIEPLSKSHKIISYTYSSIHSIFIAFFSSLYIFGIIGRYGLTQSFFISMSYYLADIVYIIDTSEKISNHNYYILLHHMIIIYYQIFSYIQNDSIKIYYGLFYLSRAFIAEYSVLPLNYCWYLLHTKQENTNKMIISSILTLILYFLTRVINLSMVVYDIWINGYFIFSLVGLPLVLLNYYWFYKLTYKAYSVNKKK